MDTEAEFETVPLDVEQFADLDDALEQVGDSRVYEQVLKAGLERTSNHTLLTMFAQSACTRFRGLHEGIVREVKEANPHAVFPLLRAHAETVLTVAYAVDHPDYVLRITERRGDQPKELKRLPIVKLVEHITPEAPGFAGVYDELCEITHFGSVALFQPHVLEGERTMQWRSNPRWRRDPHDALVACAWLKELTDAAVTYLHNFVGRHVIERAPAPDPT